jgi:hypothetical protein
MFFISPTLIPFMDNPIMQVIVRVSDRYTSIRNENLWAFQIKRGCLPGRVVTSDQLIVTS